MTTEVTVALVSGLSGLGTAIFVYLRTTLEAQKTIEKVSIVQDTLSAYESSVQELRIQLKEALRRMEECERERTHLQQQILRLLSNREEVKN